MKLTPKMLQSIRELQEHGGECHYKIGGWWQSLSDGGFEYSFNTASVKALAKRNFLEPIPGKYSFHSAYRLVLPAASALFQETP